MPEYVYAIVEPRLRPPEKRGIAGAPLRLIRGSGLAALVSELPSRTPRLGRDELLVHASVLEAALPRSTVLPMRFGTVMKGPDAVRKRLLGENGEDLRNKLARLEGKVELRIRAVYERKSVVQIVVRGDGEIARLRETLRKARSGAGDHGTDPAA